MKPTTTPTCCGQNAVYVTNGMSNRLSYWFCKQCKDEVSLEKKDSNLYGIQTMDYASAQRLVNSIHHQISSLPAPTMPGIQSQKYHCPDYGQPTISCKDCGLDLTGVSITALCNGIPAPQTSSRPYVQHDWDLKLGHCKDCGVSAVLQFPPSCSGPVRYIPAPLQPHKWGVNTLICTACGVGVSAHMRRGGLDDCPGHSHNFNQHGQCIDCYCYANHPGSTICPSTRPATNVPSFHDWHNMTGVCNGCGHNTRTAAVTCPTPIGRQIKP